MLICMRCGQRNEPDATFCSNRECGAVLEWEGQRVETDDDPTVEDRGMSAIKPDRPSDRRQRPRQAAVQASLTPTTLDVEPGENTSCEMRVRNQGTIVDQFGVQVTGPAASWASCEPTSINLYPDGEGTVTVRFAPPRAPQPAAGTVPYQVRVTSTQDPSVSVVDGGMVTVAPFEELTSELAPETGQGRRSALYELTTENRGNTSAHLAVHAHDPDQQLNCEVVPTPLTCPAGATQLATIDVQAKQRHWIGSPQRHPFTVTATRPDDPAHIPVFQKQGAFKQKAILPYWLLAAIALLLVLGVLAWLFLRSDAIAVPNVIGQTEEVAERTLISAGLVLGQREFQLSEESPGTVIAQDPEPEAEVDPGTQVDIIVAAAELVDVPRLVGMTLDEAEAELTARGLALGDIAEEPSAQDEGTVLDQDPAPGELVPPDFEVDLTVAVHVVVPRVIGQSEGPAQQALREAGLEMNVADREPSGQPEGVVIRQDPPSGETVPAGTVVDVILSMGPDDEDDDNGNGNGDGDGIAVPNVVGERLQDARDQITGAGLQVGTITQQDVQPAQADGPSGRVTSQNPATGEQVPANTQVNLVVRAVVVDEGAEILTANQWLDLDIGDFAGGGAPPGADLHWTTEEVEQPRLTPLGGAQFADLGTRSLAEFRDLRLDQLEDALQDPNLLGPVTGITEGTTVAIRTNDGNIAKLIVVERLMPMNLDIEWVTYEPSG